MEHDNGSSEPDNRRLDSWKDIASFFGRDERTVRRWEKERSLPVHRMPGKPHGSVYAFVEELSEWLKRANSPRAEIHDGIFGRDLDRIGLEASSSVSMEPAVVMQPATSASFLSRNRGRSAAGIVVVALIAFFGWRLLRPNQPSSAGRAIHSIAVLPLENLTGDRNQEYLVDGLTDSLITNVARIQSLAVISRSSVMAYKGTHKPMREIARELHVDAVIEGSVSESNGVIRVNAQLLRGDNDTHLWAGQFEGDLKDVLRLQSEVTEAIAKQIHAEVLTTGLPIPGTSSGMNSQAYEPYLRGRYFLNKRDYQDLATAIGYFKQAISLDPNFAEAYSGLADCYILQVLNGGVENGFELAQAAAAHAMEFDERLSEAHASLGSIMALHQRNWTATEREFKRALELNPSNAQAHQWYAVLYLAPIGRLDEALAEIDRAHNLDPLSAIIETDRGFVHYLRKEYSEATEDFKMTLELDPTFVPAHFRIAYVYAELGRFDEFVKERQAIARIDKRKTALSAEGIEKAYQAEGIRGYQQLYEDSYSRTGDPGGELGFLRMQGRDINGAFRVYFVLADRHDLSLFYLAVDPMFDPIRSDSRYKKLLQRTGLPSS